MQLIKFKNKLTNGQTNTGRIENGSFTLIYLTKRKKNNVKAITTNGCYAIILLILKLISTIFYNPAVK